MTSLIEIMDYVLGSSNHMHAQIHTPLLSNCLIRSMFQDWDIAQVVGRVFTKQAQGPEFKPQYLKKKKLIK
jgi:hypothetical protein